MGTVTKKQRNAKDIVIQTMERCKKNYWEFTEAISLLEPKPFPQKCLTPLSTDGEKLFYSDEKVMNDYNRDVFETLSHELMHVVLHLVFDDPEGYRNTKTRKLYSAYADTRNDIAQYYLEVPKEKQGHNWYYCGLPALNKYFGYSRFMDDGEKLPDSFFELKNNRSLAGKVLKRYQAEDDHELWMKPVNKAVEAKWTKVRAQIVSTGTDPVDIGRGQQPVTVKADDITKMLMERDMIMPSFDMGGSQEYGSETGSVSEKFRAAEDNGNTYIDHIREFFKEREDSREDPEMIDRMMYSYGFDLYEDVALIEPSEETDKKALGTIAIAIDTSGSCYGEVARQFLREISNLLRDISDIGSFDSILFYQCDCSIQSRKVLTEPGDIPGDADDHTLMGFGGTSFIPVFEDIEKYEKDNDFKVDALFYLTDGWGDYPQKEPPYKTFFILPEADFDSVNEYESTPEWITKLCIKEGI